MKKIKTKSKISPLVIIILIIAVGAFAAFQYNKSNDQKQVSRTSSTGNSLSESVFRNEFIAYSRSNELEASAKITEIFNNASGSQLSAKNISSKDLGNFIKLRDCKENGEPLDIGLIDPFMFGCFQRNNNNLKILMVQSGCNVSSFVIADAKSNLTIDGLKDKNMIMLGQSRAAIVSMHLFADLVPTQFNIVAYTQKNDLAFQDFDKKLSDVLVVVGFKYGNKFTIPLIKVEDTTNFQSTFPKNKIIDQRDLGIPCYVLAVSDRFAKNLNPESIKKIENDFNNPEILKVVSKITESSEPFTNKNVEKIQSTISLITETSFKNTMQFKSKVKRGLENLSAEELNKGINNQDPE